MQIGGCSLEPTLDASTENSYRNSLNAITAALNDEKAKADFLLLLDYTSDLELAAGARLNQEADWTRLVYRDIDRLNYRQIVATRSKVLQTQIATRQRLIDTYKSQIATLNQKIVFSNLRLSQRESYKFNLQRISYRLHNNFDHNIRSIKIVVKQQQQPPSAHTEFMLNLKQALGAGKAINGSFYLPENATKLASNAPIQIEISNLVMPNSDFYIQTATREAYQQRAQIARMQALLGN